MHISGFNTQTAIVKACINKTMCCYGVARQPTIYVWGVATHPPTVGFSWESCERNVDLKCFVADNLPLMWLFSLNSASNQWPTIASGKKAGDFLPLHSTHRPHSETASNIAKTETAKLPREIKVK